MSLVVEESSVEREIALAKHEVGKRKAAYERAGVKLRAAEGQLGELIEQRDGLLIEKWGDNPDLGVLLKSETSSVLFHYANELFRGLGFRLEMDNPDTEQRCVWIEFETNAASEVARLADSVRLVAPYLKVGDGDVKTFCIGNLRSLDYPLVLAMNTLLSNVSIRSVMLGKEVKKDSRLEFASLEAALEHIQEHIADVAPVQRQDSIGCA